MNPELFFTTQLIREPSPIQGGDQLLEINGQTIQTILDAQHNVFKRTRPDWPDGTILQYKVMRDGMPRVLDVSIRRLPYWSYFPSVVQLNAAVITQLAGSLFFFFAGLIVFLLRPGNYAAHALLFIGVGFFFNAVPANFTAPTLAYPNPPVSIPFDTWTLAINPSLMYLVLVFPQPKLPLRRFPRLGVLLLYLPWLFLFNLAYLFNLDNRIGYLQAAYAIYPLQGMILMLVTLSSLIHSAITLRDPVGRSQFKWMLAGISSFVFMGVGGWLVSAYLFPDSMAQGNWLLTTLGWFLLPICLAIAITRYRLFDIDLIIRRTLQYAILTGVLGLLYFGSVLLGQRLVGALTGDPDSPLVLVVSTLLVAALFNPLARPGAGFHRPALLSPQVRRHPDPGGLHPDRTRRDPVGSVDAGPFGGCAGQCPARAGLAVVETPK